MSAIEGKLDQLSIEAQLLFLQSEVEKAKREHNPYWLRMLLSITESVKVAQRVSLNPLKDLVG